MKPSPADQLRQKVIDLKGKQSQEAFATELGVDQGTISRYLAGEAGLGKKLGRKLIDRYAWLAPDVIAVLLGRDMRNVLDDSTSDDYATN